MRIGLFAIVERSVTSKITPAFGAGRRFEQHDVPGYAACDVPSGEPSLVGAGLGEQAARISPLSMDRRSAGESIVYDELAANALALQTVVGQTQALHSLKSEGVPVDLADLAFLSPYPTSKLERFGDQASTLIPEAMPTTTSLSV